MLVFCRLKGAATTNGLSVPEQSYVNVEEEILEENADVTFEVKIDKKAAQPEKSSSGGASSSSGFVDLSQSEYEMSANILVFSANKSELLIDALKREFPLPP